MDKNSALLCIEIIKQRTPLNLGEIKLLETIVNDIRVKFDLPGALSLAQLGGGAGEPPKEWIW